MDKVQCVCFVGCKNDPTTSDTKTVQHSHATQNRPICFPVHLSKINTKCLCHGKIKSVFERTSSYLPKTVYMYVAE